MATGDLITGDWQFEFNGLLLGDGTDYPVIDVPAGLLDTPAVRSSDQTRFRRDGLHQGDDFLSGRSITLTFELWADSAAEFEDNIQSFVEAFVTSRSEKELAFRVPGMLDGSDGLIRCRVRNRRVPIANPSFQFQNTTASVQLFSTDPRILDVSATSVNIPVVGPSSGFQFNLTFNLTFGVGSATSVQVTNTGNYVAEPVFTFNGPCANPKVINETLDQSLQFNLAIATGDTLVVDTSDRTVLLNGTANRYSTIDDGSEWFGLEPGSTNLSYRADNATGSTLDVDWRNSWV